MSSTHKNASLTFAALCGYMLVSRRKKQVGEIETDDDEKHKRHRALSSAEHQDVSVQEGHATEAQTINSANAALAHRAPPRIQKKSKHVLKFSPAATFSERFKGKERWCINSSKHLAAAEEIKLVPDLGYEFYVERFMKKTVYELNDIIYGPYQILDANIRHRLVCNNYVDALLNVYEMKRDQHDLLARKTEVSSAAAQGEASCSSLVTI